MTDPSRVVSLPVVLRVVAAGSLILAALVAGWIGRSLWIVPWLGLAFSVGFVLGKWRVWERTVAAAGPVVLTLSVLITMAVQCALVGALYFMGGMLRSRRPVALALADVWAALGVGAFAAAMGLWALWLERRRSRANGADRDRWDGASDGLDDDLEDDLGRAVREPEFGVALDPNAVSVESFFAGPNFSHTGEEHPVGPSGLPAAAITKPGMIEATEARLGVRLPALLRELYEQQNGGALPSFYVPLLEAGGGLVGWRGVLADGFSELRPLEGLANYRDHRMDYIDPEDPEELSTIPHGAEQWIVLSWYHSDCTLLDYSQPGSAERGDPGVVVRNFDPEDEPVGPEVRFPSFEEFFAALRRL